MRTFGGQCLVDLGIPGRQEAARYHLKHTSMHVYAPPTQCRYPCAPRVCSKPDYMAHHDRILFSPHQGDHGSRLRIPSPRTTYNPCDSGACAHYNSEGHQWKHAHLHMAWKALDANGSHRALVHPDAHIHHELILVTKDMETWLAPQCPPDFVVCPREHAFDES